MTRVFLAFLVTLSFAAPAAAANVRLADLGHFQGERQYPLVGYGIVVGLSGTGDSPRSEVTRQTLANVLGRLGVNLSSDDIQSRNVAAVIVTAKLPSSANAGDTIDVQVSSAGDARSLVGGTLLLTPMLGPDQQPYAFAQGQVVVGGYQFEADLNRQQRNFPASGVMSGGATVEKTLRSDLLTPSNELVFVLDEPNFTTAQRAADAVNGLYGATIARADGDSAIRIVTDGDANNAYRLISTVESLAVSPAGEARVVVNERSGTIVAGADVQISSVVISQGDIKVSVSVRNEGSQPVVFGGRSDQVSSLIVTNTKLDVATDDNAVVAFPSTTVADLVQGLRAAKVNTRGMISILQAMKSAGALHAEIIVQ